MKGSTGLRLFLRSTSRRSFLILDNPHKPLEQEARRYERTAFFQAGWPEILCSCHSAKCHARAECEPGISLANEQNEPGRRPKSLRVFFKRASCSSILQSSGCEHYCDGTPLSIVLLE